MIRVWHRSGKYLVAKWAAGELVAEFPAPADVTGYIIAETELKIFYAAAGLPLDHTYVTFLENGNVSISMQY